MLISFNWQLPRKNKIIITNRFVLVHLKEQVLRGCGENHWKAIDLCRDEKKTKNLITKLDHRSIQKQKKKKRVFLEAMSWKLMMEYGAHLAVRSKMKSPRKIFKRTSNQIHLRANILNLNRISNGFLSEALQFSLRFSFYPSFFLLSILVDFFWSWFNPHLF